MYRDTVTIFNRKKGRGGDTWYPTVLTGVNLNKDKGEIYARYGAESSDNAVLNVRYDSDGENIVINGRTWMQPKQWRKPSSALSGMRKPQQAVTGISDILCRMR